MKKLLQKIQGNIALAIIVGILTISSSAYAALVIPEFFQVDSAGTGLVMTDTTLNLGASSTAIAQGHFTSLRSGYFIATSTTASSTFANGITLTNGCLRVGGSCITSGTTYTGTYPVQVSGSVISLAFGTTTSNTWGGTQTFTNAITLSTALTEANGGTGGTDFTAGSVVFSNGTSLIQDNTNLYWDDTNNRLGIGGTTTPQRTLSVAGPIVSSECNLTDGATVTFNLASCNQGKVVLGGNRALDFTNETQALGQGVRVVVCQDATGSRTLTHDASVRWAGGTAPTLTTTANKCDVLAGFTSDATGTPIILLDKVLSF